jgi:tripeptide aminopeptidase
MKEKILERFLRYVKTDTQSDPASTQYPSSKKQLILAKMLAEELKQLGLTGISSDKYGYVMATLHSNIEKKVPVIGFLSHMDTSPDMSGTNVNPRVVDNYDGEELISRK